MAIFFKKIPLNFVLHYLRRQLNAFEGSVKGVVKKPNSDTKHRQNGNYTKELKIIFGREVTGVYL
jgi:hypothetical protein